MTYVGTETCASCHETQWKAWAGSHHDLSMQEASAETVLGDFDDATFEHQGLTTTFSTVNRTFRVRTEGADGRLHDFEIAYCFGIYPLQQYLVRTSDGRLQALDICWDARSRQEGGQRWFHLRPNERIAPGDPLHWSGPYQNWNHMCAQCHSTGVRKGYDARSNTFSTTWAQIDVACEACHGPGSAHTAWAGSPQRTPDHPASSSMGLVVRFGEKPPPVLRLDDARGIIRRDRPRAEHAELDTCAPCHSRRTSYSEEHSPGQSLAQSFRLALLESDLYEADGQIKDEAFEYGSFLQSRMYAAGVTCSDCHDPHSLKTPGGNQTCAKCHVPSRFDTREHHRHEPGTPGSACVDCHAPTRNYMVIHARHDHSFRVPRPDLTLKVGSPNACATCHADRSIQWVVDAYKARWGSTREETHHYAEALHAARQARSDAPDLLLRLLDDPAQPAIVRATAVEAMGELGGSVASTALEHAITDADPQVRAAVARSLGAFASDNPAMHVSLLVPLLSDPVRQVRMDAAIALAATPVAQWPSGSADAMNRALSEVRAAELNNADRAEARMNLASLSLALGDPDAARQEYEAAIRLNPAFAPAYVNLADLRRAQRREPDAESILRDGLEHAPRDAALHHALGLALVRQGRIGEALPELRLAHQSAPDLSRYAYVLAVALESNGCREEAIELLRRVCLAHPSDADSLAALAVFCRDAGRLDDAIAHARQLTALRPDDVEARELVRQIQKLRLPRAPDPLQHK